MPTLKHLHKYRRMRSGKFFRCIDPECSHYIHKELLVDKRALCGICSKEFILDNEALRRAIPRCLECTDSKKSRNYKAAKNIVEGLFSNESVKEGQIIWTE